MNQILVTERLYVTPELKKKKQFYRIEFFISIFLVCVLFSYYIYAEYDKSKGEEYAKEILANTNIEDVEKEDKTIKDELLVVVLDEEKQKEKEQEEEEKEPEIVYTEEITKAGTKYCEVAKINIPRISVSYSVLGILEPSASYGTNKQKAEEKAIEELLKMSPCRFHGADLDKGIFDANKVGNFCIVGHNYRSSKFFSKVKNLEANDIIELTDARGITLKYSVYDKYTVDPSDVSATTQHTNGRKDVTLITCTDDNSQRWIVKATEIL